MIYARIPSILYLAIRMNTSSQPEITILEIVYEDEYLLGVNKPNNFLIHQSHFARNIREITLLDLLQKQLDYPVYPVHRLDRKTSGIILLAKQTEFVTKFQDLFTTNSISKSYYAIVRGFTENQGIINSPVKNLDTGVYKDAVTNYESINQIELDIPVYPYERSRYSLIKLTPETGRMHQLRIHMNKISHPIVGDYRYGDRFHNRMFEQQFDCHYLFLHAVSLEFTHPYTNQHLRLQAGFPADWQFIFSRFNWKNPLLTRD